MINSSKIIPISFIELFILFFRLGCTSFGGPIAHISFFHQEFVIKRKWYSDTEYLQIVALCQFLPGPASSQVGIAIGLTSRGYLGSLISFIGFTLPSAVIMIVFAYLVDFSGDLSKSTILYGLKIVAVAVVAQAILTMSKAQCTEVVKIAITAASVILALMINHPFSQLMIIILAGIAGYLFCKTNLTPTNDLCQPEKVMRKPNASYISIGLVLLFFLFLIGLPILQTISKHDLITIFDSFYRSGALVFGGGHVVLPLLENELVSTRLIDNEQFLYGYSAAQAIPGPLFTFASYLGTLSVDYSSPLVGSLLATLAIFLPGYLLVVSLLPHWQLLCSNEKLNKAISGINASVVGLLIASFIHPIWLESIHTSMDVIFTTFIFIGLTIIKLSPLKIISIVFVASLGFDLLFS